MKARRLGRLLVEDFGWPEESVEDAAKRQDDDGKTERIGHYLGQVGSESEVALAVLHQGLESRELAQTATLADEIDRACADLSLEDLAILFNASDPAPGPEQASDRLQVIATPKSYIWFAILAGLVRERPEVDEARLASAVQRMISDNRDPLLELYRPRAGRPRGASLDLSSSLLASFWRALEVPDRQARDLQSRAHDAIDSSFARLERKGLIQDPFSIGLGAALVGVLAFVPIRIDVRTGPGNYKSLRIEALLWRYERVVKGDRSRTCAQFRLWKLIQAFKDSFFETLEDELGGNGDEADLDPNGPEDLTPDSPPEADSEEAEEELPPKTIKPQRRAKPTDP